MALWILLISFVLFLVTFIGLTKKPALRYISSMIFLTLGVICSITLMLNDTKHLGMKNVTRTETQTLVSTAGEKSPLGITVYKKLGNGKEKIFVYRTQKQPHKTQTTKVDYNVTTKIEHCDIKKPQIKIQESYYTYKNDFWRMLLGGLGLNKEVDHYTYTFKVPDKWLILSTTQVKVLENEEKVNKTQLEAHIKAQLPSLVKAKMQTLLQKEPHMDPTQQKKLTIKITNEEKNKLTQKLIQQEMTKIMPQLEKESL